MQQLQLILSNPFHQDWNEMSANDPGKFCNSCAKTVVDFSAMTDAQLMNYFANLKNESVCGRVHSDQVQRTITTLPQPRKKIFDYWQYALSMLLLLGKGQQSRAQSGGVNIQQFGTSAEASSKKLHKVLASSEVQRIQIVDEKMEPVSGASIKFESGGSYLFADSMGYVSLSKSHAEDSIFITAIGFKNKVVNVKDIAGGIINLDADKLLLDVVKVSALATSRTSCSMTLGWTSYRVIRTPGFKDTLQNIVNRINPSIAVFPNPVARGGLVNLSVKLKNAGRYSVYITDVTGKLLSAQDYIAADKKSIRQIQIASQWSAGIYFVIVTDDKGKNIGKEKIVVM